MKYVDLYIQLVSQLTCSENSTLDDEVTSNSKRNLSYDVIVQLSYELTDDNVSDLSNTHESGIFCIVGSAPAQLLVRTCHAVPTATCCTGHVDVVPQNIGAKAVRVDTQVPQSATHTSVPPGAK